MASIEQAAWRRLVRPAKGTDAYELADVRNASQTTGADADTGQDPMREELDFIDRLSLPHGDDYFCIVADDNGAIAGYLIGGGSRDLDRKAHGEIYEIAVLPSSRRRGIGRALMSEALERFDEAAFAGTLLSAPADDAAIAGLAAACGMHHESLRGPDESIVRYERLLPRRAGS